MNAGIIICSFFIEMSMYAYDSTTKRAAKKAAPVAIPEAEKAEPTATTDQMLDGLLMARSTELSRLNEQLQHATAQMNQLNASLNELRSKMINVQGVIAGIKAAKEVLASKKNSSTSST